MKEDQERQSQREKKKKKTTEEGLSGKTLTEEEKKKKRTKSPSDSGGRWRRAPGVWHIEGRRRTKRRRSVRSRVAARDARGEATEEGG